MHFHSSGSVHAAVGDALHIGDWTHTHCAGTLGQELEFIRVQGAGGIEKPMKLLAAVAAVLMTF